MRTEISGILQSINEDELPLDADALFGDMWDSETRSFRTQETYVLDFKDRAPEKFTDSYGASIVRLAIAMHNTYGGIVVFGIDDETKKPSGKFIDLDVEAFADIFTLKTGSRVEFKLRKLSLGSEDYATILLVPRREHSPPLVLNEGLGPYPAGVLWFRDRHSVREFAEDALPVLYSDRGHFFDSNGEKSKASVHRSLPPSPATMQSFVGRKEMLRTLWDWLVFDSRPRYYLHGHGGSGKSTLAYEFCRQVSERGGEIKLSKEENLDYVIFISSKETELNIHRGKEQPFYLRRFTDVSSQFQAILVDTGILSASDAAALSANEIENHLSELFNSYNGLIVIDDIDALSREGKDTGEETLLFSLMAGARKTKVLYTLRHPPSSALASSLKVPGLEKNDEFPTFVDLFSRQLGVSHPSKKQLAEIERASSRLPLLIETVIGLHAVCGSYDEALAQFSERGGDAARRYLYQREYDRLEKAGRAREVLAALYLLDEEVTFSVLSRILGFGDESVRAAIGECGAIFLLAETDGSGTTKFQLAHPSKEFIGAVSSDLQTYGALSRRVELFLREDAAYTAEESSLIVELEQLIRKKQFQDVVDLYESRPRNDPILSNQKIQGLVGQAYSHLGPNARTKARECFEAAYRLKFIDVFMARAWFYVENESDYGSKNAIEVCERFLAQSHISARHRSEFKSKLASCYLEQARRLSSISREKSVVNFKLSISNYLSALWIARYTDQIDEALTLRWLRVPCVEFVKYLDLDLDPFFEVIMELPDQRHDVHLEGAHELMSALRASRADRDAQARRRIKGLTKKTIRSLEKSTDEDDQPGFAFVLATLRVIETKLTG